MELYSEQYQYKTLLQDLACSPETSVDAKYEINKS